MRLISSTSDFLISGRPYPGFPILLWDNMEGCWPVNEFSGFISCAAPSAQESRGSTLHEHSTTISAFSKRTTSVGTMSAVVSKRHSLLLIATIASRSMT